MDELKDEGHIGSPGAMSIDEYRNKYDTDMLHDRIEKLTEENDKLRCMISRLRSALHAVLESQHMMTIDLE